MENDDIKRIMRNRKKTVKQGQATINHGKEREIKKGNEREAKVVTMKNKHIRKKIYIKEIHNINGTR